MVKIKTFKAKNFSVEYDTRLTSFGAGSLSYLILPNGKILEKFPRCNICGSRDCRENGYYEIVHHIFRELGMVIKNGQYECNRCGNPFHTDRSLIDSFIGSITGFIKSLLMGCAKLKMPYDAASLLVKEKLGISYCGEYVRQIYNEALAAVKEERITEASGVYNYDEQFLSVNGIEVCRLTIKDAVNGKVIADEQTADTKEETIKQTLLKYLFDLPVECFILDLAPRYPNIFHDLFPKAKIQWCIFHLHQLIWREFVYTYGKNIPLHELYNAYSLFDIFFNHTLELEKLKELMKQYEKQKTKDEKSNKLLEKGLKTAFAEFVHALKKERRRNKQNVPRRTLKVSEEKFKRVYAEKAVYPKKLTKRIEYIQENWDKFSLFQKDKRVPPTNNGLEQYFAATLSKTDKKDFRSFKTVSRDLRLFKAEWNGAEIFSSESLISILKEFMFILRAFAPT